MRKLFMLLSTVLCLAGFAMMLERSAFAYADPGSGLMALQIIGATLSAVAIYLRHKIARLFGRRPGTLLKVFPTQAALPNRSSETTCTDES